MELPPVPQQQHRADKQVEANAHVADAGVDAVGVVPLGRHGVVDGQQRRPQLRRQQKDPGRRVQPPGPAGLLLHQDGNVLIKEVYHQHHGANEETVQGVVPEAGHRVQMVHGVERGGVQAQMGQHRPQQQGECPVQGGMPPPSGIVDGGHEGHHQEKRDLHAQHPITS